MPTEVPITAGSGRDYSNLQNAIDNIITEASGSTGQLVTNDENVVITVYDNESNAGTTLFDESLQTDATRNVVITGDIYTDGTESGTGRTISTSTGNCLRIRDDHVVVRRFRFYNSNNFGIVLRHDSNAAEGCIIKQCVITGYTGSVATDNITGVQYLSGFNHGNTTPNAIKDCAFYGCTTAILLGSTTTNSDSYDLDLVNNSFTQGTGGAATTDRNVLVQGGASADATLRIHNMMGLVPDSALNGEYLVSGSISVTTTGSSNNFGTDGTDSWPGTGTPHPTTQTTSTTPGAGDWAIYTSDTDATLVDDSDSDVLDNGVGPASQALVEDEDIEGTARAGTTCDPGAFQVTATASGAVTPQLINVSAIIRRNVRL